MKKEKHCFYLVGYGLAFLLAVAGISGCAGGSVFSSYGGLQKNLDVEKIFMNGEIMPDYTYYYQGVASGPEAIIAINNKFTLQSRLWQKAEWTEKEFKDAVFWMQREEVGFCTNDGGYLLAPGNVQIGIWYSQRTVSRVNLPEHDVVQVYPFDFMAGSPCLRQYEMDQR